MKKTLRVGFRAPMLALVIYLAGKPRLRCDRRAPLRRGIEANPQGRSPWLEVSTSRVNPNEPPALGRLVPHRELRTRPISRMVPARAGRYKCQGLHRHKRLGNLLLEVHDSGQE